MLPLRRDSPDESQTGINVRGFPAVLQDRHEVRTATSTSGNPNAWSRVSSDIFLGIWTHCLCRLLLNAWHRTSHASAGGGCGCSSAMSRRILQEFWMHFFFVAAASS